MEITDNRTLTDFHSHILPGIDDGAKDAEMSEKMLLAEKEQGVGRIVLTPHFYLQDNSVEQFLEKRARSAEKLAPLTEKHGIEVKYGAEVLYTGSLADKELDKLCIGDTRYIMIELPYRQLTDRFISEFRSFAGSLFPDLIPILAHAERYLNFTSARSIYEIMESDILVQLNSGDFRAFSGSSRFMYDLLRKDLAHLLGTDCHNITSRPPNLAAAQKAISKKMSADCFDRLMRNAEKVFAGELL